jgi:hypothetical protein
MYLETIYNQRYKTDGLAKIPSVPGIPKTCAKSPSRFQLTGGLPSSEALF